MVSLGGTGRAYSDRLRGWVTFWLLMAPSFVFAMFQEGSGQTADHSSKVSGQQAQVLQQWTRQDQQRQQRQDLSKKLYTIQLNRPAAASAQVYSLAPRLSGLYLGSAASPPASAPSSSFASLSLASVSADDLMPLSMEQLHRQYPHIGDVLSVFSRREGSAQEGEKESVTRRYAFDADTIAKQLLTHNALDALNDFIGLGKDNHDEHRQLCFGTRIFFASLLTRVLTAMPDLVQSTRFIGYLWPGLHFGFSEKTDSSERRGATPEDKVKVDRDRYGNKSRMDEITNMVTHWQLAFSASFQVDSEQAMNVFQNILHSRGTEAVEVLFPGPEQLSDPLLYFSNQFPVAFALSRMMDNRSMYNWWLSHYAGGNSSDSRLESSVRARSAGFGILALEQALKQRLQMWWGVVDEGKTGFLANAILHAVYRQRAFLYRHTRPFNPLPPGTAQLASEQEFYRRLDPQAGRDVVDRNVKQLLQALNTLALSGPEEGALAADATLSLLELPLFIIPVAQLVAEVQGLGNSPDYIFRWLESVTRRNRTDTSLHSEIAIREWGMIRLHREITEAEPEPFAGKIYPELEGVSSQLCKLLNIDTAENLSRKYCSVLQRKQIATRWGMEPVIQSANQPVYRADSMEEVSWRLSPLLMPTAAAKRVPH